MSMKHYIRKIDELEEKLRSCQRAIRISNQLEKSQAEEIKDLKRLNRSQELTIEQFRMDD